MFANTRDLDTLKKTAREARVDIIKMLTAAGSGHPGGSLSSVELLVALYFGVLKHDPKKVMPDRDRFVLSKGHGIPALYAVLGRCGYFTPGDTLSLRKIGACFQGHPDRVCMPVLEASTGSLGQGLSIAVGYALASKMDGEPYRVYCLIGDGESQEGQIWEAAMSAAKFRLDNLTAILDYNKAQIDGFVEDIMPIEPIAEKWKSFGWHVIEVPGHDYEAIFAAYDEAKVTKGRPSFILADTVKGKGVSFMENKVDWHGKSPTPEEAEKAIEEILAAS